MQVKVSSGWSSMWECEVRGGDEKSRFLSKDCDEVGK